MPTVGEARPLYGQGRTCGKFYDGNAHSRQSRRPRQTWHASPTGGHNYRQARTGKARKEAKQPAAVGVAVAS